MICIGSSVCSTRQPNNRENVLPLNKHPKKTNTSVLYWGHLHPVESADCPKFETNKSRFYETLCPNPTFYCFLIFLAPIPRSMLWHPWRSEDVPRDMIVLQESKEWNQKSKVDWLCSQKHAPMKTLWETKSWAPDSQRARLTGPFIPLSKADTSKNMIETQVQVQVSMSK